MKEERSYASLAIAAALAATGILLFFSLLSFIRAAGFIPQGGLLANPGAFLFTAFSWGALFAPLARPFTHFRQNCTQSFCCFFVLFFPS